jgi:hypothetical protein
VGLTPSTLSCRCPFGLRPRPAIPLGHVPKVRPYKRAGDGFADSQLLAPRRLPAASNAMCSFLLWWVIPPINFRLRVRSGSVGSAASNATCALSVPTWSCFRLASTTQFVGTLVELVIESVRLSRRRSRVRGPSLPALRTNPAAGGARLPIGKGERLSHRRMPTRAQFRELFRRCGNVPQLEGLSDRGRGPSHVPFFMGRWVSLNKALDQRVSSRICSARSCHCWTSSRYVAFTIGSRACVASRSHSFALAKYRSIRGISTTCSGSRERV